MKKLIILALAMLTISLTGCGTTSPAATPAVVLPAYYVNAATGLDTNAGTQAAPFKTITKALNAASVSGANINVAAGTYDVANGEVFPLTIASSATGAINLIGTGSPMLAGAGNYTISGGEMPVNGSPIINTTLAFTSGTKGSVTGFNASGTVFAAPTVIVTDNATVTISNNKFDFGVNTGYPLWLVNGSIVTVTGNTISAWVALDTADVNTKVTIRNNTFDGGFTVCTADFTANASQLDLGTVASPGNNILKKTGGGTAALNSWGAAGDQGVTAVGNTWTPNVQWADAQGHYPAGVLTGASATNGPNLNIMPTAGVQLYVVPGSVAAPHTAK